MARRTSKPTDETSEKEATPMASETSETSETSEEATSEEATSEEATSEEEETSEEASRVDVLRARMEEKKEKEEASRTSEETDAIGTYTALVMASAEEADSATGALSLVTIDKLKRALAMVKPADRLATMAKADGILSAAAMATTPPNMQWLMAGAAIKSAVDEIANSKARTIVDPLVTLANAAATLNYALDIVVNSEEANADAERFVALMKEAMGSEANRASADKLVKSLTSKSTSSGERSDVLGSLVSVAKSANAGDAFTVAMLASMTGCNGPSIDFQCKAWPKVIADAGGIMTSVDNGRGRMVRGMLVASPEEAIAAWQEANREEATSAA